MVYLIIPGSAVYAQITLESLILACFLAGEWLKLANTNFDKFANDIRIFVDITYY